MRLTQKTDFAMRVLMYLTVQAEVATVPEIASRFDISENHVMKVAHELSRAGWVQTRRGRGGGLTLAIEPKVLRIGDVVRHFEPDFRLVECFDPELNTCILTKACELEKVMRHALELVLDYLDTVTLADLTQDSKNLGQLMQIETN